MKLKEILVSLAIISVVGAATLWVYLTYRMIESLENSNTIQQQFNTELQKALSYGDEK